MNFETPEQKKEGLELIPTPEEVQTVFEQLIEGEEYKDGRRLEDEKGLYLWDVIVSKEDGNIEYSYMREGRYLEGQASVTAIHVTFFDEAGDPIGGHSVAKYIEGEWELAS